MVTARSIVGGTCIAAGGIAIGYIFDTYMSNIAQGYYAYLNDFAKTLGNLGQFAGAVGGVGAGVYEVFFSPRAQNNPPANPGAPNIPNAGPRMNVNIRGGRNILRF